MLVLANGAACVFAAEPAATATVTEQEMKSDAFPREAYEKGDFIGVWDQPTSGWGAPSSKFCRMWVVNMKAPSGKGMMLLIK